MFDQLVRRLRRRGGVHAAVSVNSGRDGQVTATTSTRVDPEEADEQKGEVLPERHAMTVMQPPHIVGAPIASLPVVEEPPEDT